MIYLLPAQKLSVTKHEGCVQNKTEHTTVCTVSSMFTCTLYECSVHDQLDCQNVQLEHNVYMQYVSVFH